MKICIIPDCDKKSIANGYCAKHNARYKKYGDPLAPIRSKWDGHVKTQKKCSNETCSNMVWKCKYCPKCRMRKHRHGDINIVKPKHRDHFFNENLLDSWSRESAWLLGWLASDGCVQEDNKSYKLSWSLKDKEPLDIIQRILNDPRNPVSFIKDNKSQWGSSS